MAKIEATSAARQKGGKPAGRPNSDVKLASKLQCMYM
jgi:hypothetical protein